MTIQEFENHAIELLDEISDNSRFEAEQLIQFALGISKNELLVRRKDILSADVLSSLESLLSRRLEREPLQYICGEWEFFGLRIFCGKGCLIPRPETEMLSEYAIKHIPQGGSFLDICTGSGCISVSILKNRPDVTAVAVDISENALEYALKNAEHHGVADRIKFVCMDMAEYIPDKSVDMILSNPPYIKTEDMETLSPEVRREPHIALDGGTDELDFYKIICDKYSKYLNKKGKTVLEVGYDIAEDVKDMFVSNNFKAIIVNDIFGVKRMCVAENV